MTSSQPTLPSSQFASIVTTNDAVVRVLAEAVEQAIIHIASIIVFRTWLFIKVIQANALLTDNRSTV